MTFRRFGKTGLRVSALGFGAMQLGEPGVADAAAGRMLNRVLDAGVNLIDTARGYKLSEERIGRHIAHRRDEYVLSSKCGYRVEGTRDWTAACVTRGVERALRLMRTDRIDIMHLHSCPIDTLRRGERTGEVVDALLRAVQAGKVRVAAYSGENEARAFAIASRRFGSIQTSVNVCDQRVLDEDLGAARRLGLGVIAKRPLANAFWRYATRPRGEYCETYWERARVMGLSEVKAAAGRLGWDELALRFSAFTPGVHTVITGTADWKHFRRNLAIVGKGPLPRGVYRAIRAAFSANEREWAGQV